jgi:hypothetical protein
MLTVPVLALIIETSAVYPGAEGHSRIFAEDCGELTCAEPIYTKGKGMGIGVWKELNIFRISIVFEVI